MSAVLVFAALAFGIHQYRVRVVVEPNYPIAVSRGEVVVDVATGASGSEIAALLFKLDVVKSAQAFFRVAVGDPRSAQIAPGSHLISTQIPAREALGQLLDKKRLTSLVKVVEGAWVTEVFAELQRVGFSSSALYAALPKVILPPGFSGSEGLLFPAQYSFAKGTSALFALQEMADQFTLAAKVSGIYRPSQEFSEMQLLTIASLLQAEGNVEDFSKISRVVRNRLNLGMPLQFDSTVHYVTRTRGKVFLSINATMTPSLYNTYLHNGLPPGPIGNPGLAAMQAALTPSVGDWIFFITVKPGDTRFTASANQFLKWKAEYEINLRAGAFS